MFFPPATPGTTQTLAHNDAVFTGKQNTAGAGTASLLPGREGPSKGSAQPLVLPAFPPSLSKGAPKLGPDLDEQLKQPEAKPCKIVEKLGQALWQRRQTFHRLPSSSWPGLSCPWDPRA